MMSPPFIAFDLDGTLVDSRRDLTDAASELVMEHGATALTEMQVGAMLGDGARVLVRRAFAAAGLPPPAARDQTRFLEIYNGRLLDHTRPYEGIVEVLEGLRGRAVLAVLTNKPLASTRQVLEGLGLAGFFIDVVGGDGPIARKPAPDGLRYLAARAGASPEETWLVGDSAVDLWTARNSGAQIAMARYGFGFNAAAAALLTGTEVLIDEPLQILSLVGRLPETIA